MPENKSTNEAEIIFLTDVRQSTRIATAMTKTITFRPGETDRKIIDKLAGKLGIKTSQVIKIALRKLAEAENLKLKAS